MTLRAIESIESIVQQAIETQRLTLNQESKIKSHLLAKTFTHRDLAALSHLTNAMVAGTVNR